VAKGLGYICHLFRFRLNCHPQQINLIFGKHVGESSTGDAMRKMFNKFLEHTTIRSEKKLHLARRTVPSLMEDMG
jgi:hypothetical protein